MTSSSDSQTANTFDIVSVGSVVQDISFRTDLAEVIDNPTPDPTREKLIAFEYGAKVRSNDITFTMGGGAANTASGLAKLGLNNAALVRVGDDDEGKSMTAKLEAAGVSTAVMQHDTEHHTGMSFLVIENKTNEHVALVHYGANEQLDMSEAVLGGIATDWFYVSSLSQASWLEDMQRLVQHGAKIAWNPGATQLANPEGVQSVLEGITVLILNKDEATELALATGFTMEDGEVEEAEQIRNLLFHLHMFGSQQVVITNGRGGTTVYNGEEIFFAKPAPDKPVDTTGAGDCFGSSYIAGLIKLEGDINAALNVAVVNSTSLVSKPGSQNGLLTWEEVQAKLA